MITTCRFNDIQFVSLELPGFKICLKAMAQCRFGRDAGCKSTVTRSVVRDGRAGDVNISV